MQITKDLMKIKKNPEHPFVDIGKQETCAEFQQKILKSRVLGARQTFQIFRQNTSFSKTIELCLNFWIGFCIT